MKVGIYSPYLDTVGGGERYMLTIAEILSAENNVDVFLDTHLQTLNLDLIKEKVNRLLDLDLSKVNFVKAPFGKGSKIWERLNYLKKYDLFFYLTDGSVFYSTAKKSILHIQSPIKVSNVSLWNKIKQSSWNLVIYNSNFTKSHCEKFWKIKGKVIYPPVNTEIFKSGKKKKQILTVGRFFGYLKGKKHELMINSFKKIIDSEKASGWSFHLAGGASKGDGVYLEELKQLTVGFPIFLHPNLPFGELKKLYSESAIYWHASGFDETDPAKMEHFGITTVEAMASGCVPVVIDAGGQTEIVDDGRNGFLWDNLEGLENKTLELILNPEKMEKFAKAGKEKSQEFSKEKFIEKINSII